MYEFTARGKFVREVDRPKQFGKSWAPTAMTFDEKGNLFVADANAKYAVAVFEGTKKVRHVFGGHGQAKGWRDKPGKFSYPSGIAVMANGWIFVADSRNRRIQVFDERGAFQRSIPTPGLPMGLVSTSSNLLLCANAERNNFTVFSPEGELLQAYGAPGFRSGEFSGPTDISVDTKSRRVFVSDSDNDRIQVWGSPKGKR